MSVIHLIGLFPIDLSHNKEFR